MPSVMKNKIEKVDSDDFDLGRFIGELVDHKKLIVSITVFFTSIAIVYALFATPVYQADALIQVEQKQTNAILNSLSQMLPDSQPQSAPEIALLQSRMVLGKTVDDLNLQAQVTENFFPIFGRGWARLSGYKFGELEIQDLYIKKETDEDPKITVTIINDSTFEIEGADFSSKGVIGKMFDDNGIRLLISKIDAEPGAEFEIKYLTRLEAIDNLQKSFSVNDQGKNTGMLNLTYTGTSPDKVSKILKKISDNYLDQNITRQAAQDSKSLDFLKEQLPVVRNNLDLAEQKLNDYRRQKDSVDLSMEAKSVLDQIVNVDNQLNALTFREAEISQLYTKGHPTYKALLEKQKTLSDEKEKLSKKVNGMPETQQEVLRLSRDVESGRAVYMQLLNREQELGIAKSSVIGNVRIIDQAITEPKPIKPKKIIILLLGIIMGLIISVGAVLLRLILKKGVESPEQLESIGLNVYANIPLSTWLIGKKNTSAANKSSIGSGLLVVDNPTDLAVEAIRSLRTTLHFAMMEARNNILMISGASPNAGKTFVSSNLAAVIAQAGLKVLFIDADMRKGYIHHILGTKEDNGLSDILSGKITIEEGIKKVEYAGFDFISRGKIPPNPAELLMHPRCSELLARVEKQYDLIIVDTPPILAVTDAAIVGQYVGTSFLVVKFEQNTIKEIDVSKKRFEQNGVEIKGCVLNAIEKRASSHYGYGYNYYGYSYKDKNS
ncbi:polysaccharide biosynthesis tyrosine autokinase [Klebsiella sp. R390]|uniref:polysaccharide biosynthesis tyrosine autokinase n=1 Tax=Klebsiella sp. R390 TaxID=2755400 RepID=UPI003DA8E27D